MKNEKMLIYDNYTKDISFFTGELKQYLMDAGYFEEPGLVEKGVARTKELLVLTDALHLKWQRADSPYIIGMLAEIYTIFYKRKIVIERGHHLMGSDEVVGRKTKNIDLVQFCDETYNLSVFMLASFGKLTLEEVFCIKYLDNPDELAICSYPNILWSCTANTKIMTDFKRPSNLCISTPKVYEMNL